MGFHAVHYNIITLPDEQEKISAYTMMLPSFCHTSQPNAVIICSRTRKNFMTSSGEDWPEGGNANPPGACSPIQLLVQSVLENSRVPVLTVPQ